ncbi:MAG: hypothetical protein IPI67_24345 [Myxococcales bacterium]|nr:hypothetical protein [Myxococcales bacterium]
MTAVVRSAGRALDVALRPWPVLGGLVADVRRSRDELIAENALLRQPGPDPRAGAPAPTDATFRAG